MSIFKKKLATIIALVCACVCFISLGLTLSSKPEQAHAATTPTITYVENVQDFIAGYNGGGGNLYGNYATVKAGGSKTNGKWTETISKNDYNSGNITITLANTQDATTTDITFNIREDNKDLVASFRTVYQGTVIAANGRIGATSYVGKGGGVGGFGFHIGQSSVLNRLKVLSYEFRSLDISNNQPYLLLFQ